MKTKALVLGLVLAFAAATTVGAAEWFVRAGSSGTGTIGNPFGTIQAAINAAVSADTIKVSQGTYLENLSISAKSLFIEGGWDSTFVERDPAARTTTIDGHQAGSCLRYVNATAGAISGFTITNGLATGNWPYSRGGGIDCNNSGPAIVNNKFVLNTAVYGGAICCYNNAAPLITGNTITRNTSSFGGGIDCYSYCSPVIIGNLITRNSAAYGGGIRCYYYSSPQVINNTIADNAATSAGGGIHARMYNSVTVTSSILWNNISPSGPEIAIGGSAMLIVRCTDVMGGAAAVYADITSTITWSIGNLNLDPLFADSANGDYHLKSIRGRWEPLAGVWVIDPVSSMCIDSGDPSGAFANEPIPNGNQVDMGNYGNTREASKSIWFLMCDADLSCVINGGDLGFIRSRLSGDPAAGDNIQADVNRDGKINVIDLIVARNRLFRTCAPVPAESPPVGAYYVMSSAVGGGILMAAVSDEKPGSLIIEGPVDPVPTGGTPPATITINVYGQQMLDFGGVQMSVLFKLQNATQTQFQLQSVAFNENLSNRFEIVDAGKGIVAFVLMSGNAPIDSKTLLFTLTYAPVGVPASGVYTVVPTSPVAGSADEQLIPLSISVGSVTCLDENQPADVSAPVIESAWAYPDVLTPADGRMVLVTVRAAITDDTDPAPTFRITSVNLGGTVAPAAKRGVSFQIVSATTVKLRADKGRVYTVNIEAVDKAGNKSKGTATVTVPR